MEAMEGMEELARRRGAGAAQRRGAAEVDAPRRQLALALERDLHASSSPALAVEVVRGILAGEWAIADHFEGEQRRFIVAQRCRAGDGRALSERERQVLELALRGHSNKFVAFELGLTCSTVSTHLRRVMAKLRVASREAMIQMLPMEELGESA